GGLAHWSLPGYGFSGDRHDDYRGAVGYVDPGGPPPVDRGAGRVVVQGSPVGGRRAGTESGSSYRGRGVADGHADVVADVASCEQPVEESDRPVGMDEDGPSRTIPDVDQRYFSS